VYVGSIMGTPGGAPDGAPDGTDDDPGHALGGFCAPHFPGTQDRLGPLGHWACSKPSACTVLLSSAQLYCQQQPRASEGGAGVGVDAGAGAGAGAVGPEHVSADLLPEPSTE
jgi:hypothetical protein